MFFPFFLRLFVEHWDVRNCAGYATGCVVIAIGGLGHDFAKNTIVRGIAGRYFVPRIY